MGVRYDALHSFNGAVHGSRIIASRFPGWQKRDFSRFR